MQRRDHNQAVTKIIITRQVDNYNYKQTVSKSGVLRESRTVSGGGGGAKRKRQSSVRGDRQVTSEGREVEEQKKEKCIICRSNCKDINECQRVVPPIQVRCEEESGGDGGQRSATEQQQKQQQQQRPECSVGGEEEEEKVTRTGMAPDRCKKDVAGSEGGGSDTVQFALDWGGGRVECASDVKEKKKKMKTSSPSSRGSVFFSGSTMFLLFIAFCMSTTTISPWNVGGLLMGPGAVLRAGASEIRVDRTLKTAQETGSKYKKRERVLL